MLTQAMDRNRVKGFLHTEGAAGYSMAREKRG